MWAAAPIYEMTVERHWFLRKFDVICLWSVIPIHYFMWVTVTISNNNITSFSSHQWLRIIGREEFAQIDFLRYYLSASHIRLMIFNQTNGSSGYQEFLCVPTHVTIFRIRPVCCLHNSKRYVLEEIFPSSSRTAEGTEEERRRRGALPLCGVAEERVWFTRQSEVVASMALAEAEGTSPLHSLFALAQLFVAVQWRPSK